VSEVQDTVSEDFLTLARLALSDKAQDVTLFLTKTARRYRQSDPEGSERLSALVRSATGRSSALRREAGIPIPTDADSRLHLLRTEHVYDAAAPVLSKEIETQLAGLLRERRSMDRLLQSGLMPTRSALFVGPPGVGKTMSARWIASELQLPLLILDLSAVMSSFLGRTGNNVRAVLDYAKRQSCVLLLDELDAIAKRRDDATEVGELKRLVTVLLQEVDEWPASGILLAASNHPELLDPAIWRRFDMLITFPMPSREDVARAIREFFEPENRIADEWIDVLSIVMGHSSYSEIQKRVTHIRRACVLDNLPLDDEVRRFVQECVSALSHAETIDLAEKLAAVPSISQRAASEITGVSRVTIRKRTQQDERSHGG
jgi:SpoVK/Ycf46/Vps4 family AAA+-type ATPase